MSVKSDKSIEQIVQELDAKFSNAITHLMFNLLNDAELESYITYGDCGSFFKSSTQYRLNDKFEFILFFEREDVGCNSFSLTLMEDVLIKHNFVADTLSECVKKAHDYFIVKGSEL